MRNPKVLATPQMLPPPLWSGDAVCVLYLQQSARECLVQAWISLSARFSTRTMVVGSDIEGRARRATQRLVMKERTLKARAELPIHTFFLSERKLLDIIAATSALALSCSRVASQLTSPFAKRPNTDTVMSDLVLCTSASPSVHFLVSSGSHRDRRYWTMLVLYWTGP